MGLEHGFQSPAAKTVLAALKTIAAARPRAAILEHVEDIRDSESAKVFHGKAAKAPARERSRSHDEVPPKAQTRAKGSPSPWPAPQRSPSPIHTLRLPS